MTFFSLSPQSLLCMVWFRMARHIERRKIYMRFHICFFFEGKRRQVYLSKSRHSAEDTYRVTEVLPTENKVPFFLTLS
jgi:hypothetical protein